MESDDSTLAPNISCDHQWLSLSKGRFWKEANMWDVSSTLLCSISLFSGCWNIAYVGDCFGPCCGNVWSSPPPFFRIKKYIPYEWPSRKKVWVQNLIPPSPPPNWSQQEVLKRCSAGSWCVCLVVTLSPIPLFLILSFEALCLASANNSGPEFPFVMASKAQYFQVVFNVLDFYCNCLIKMKKLPSTYDMSACLKLFHAFLLNFRNSIG